MNESKKVGFAALSAERRREIASMGGKAAHAKGAAHEFSGEQARVAGQAGGAAVLEKLGPEHFRTIGRKGGAAVSQSIEHMREIGRKGGHAVSGDREHMANIGRKGGAARGAEEDA